MIDLLPVQGQPGSDLLRLQTVIDGDQGIDSAFLLRERESKPDGISPITSCKDRGIIAYSCKKCLQWIPEYVNILFAV